MNSTLKVRGSTLNLSTSSANARLPSNLLVEPNSRLRVANPLLDRTTLQVHMLGKRHIDMSRMKQAVLRKEHEGRNSHVVDSSALGAVTLR